ncbi:outer membrane protein assembly factor BamE [Acetobacter senegalensis]|uniref:outer membrane protein assembly factor BamE n=1 Tax=Acetobacter senegalensis TaxID=446692 RepID=UPI000A6799A1|nr:outer membrane protein assembly factor BamE [Acetobacter senegalensis]
MRRFLGIGLIGLLVILPGCSSSGNERVEKETDASVSQKIIDGQTTKSQIKQYYGDPDNVDFKTKNQEVWTYTFSKTRTPVFVSTPFQQVQKTNKKTITIYFENNIVVNHAFSSANSERRDFHL